MNIVHATNENFENEIKEGKVLIDFYADWCGPCQMISPILEVISKERDDVKIVKVDVDQYQDIASKYAIMSMPTMIILQNGEVVDKKVGLVSKEELITWIESK